MTGCSFVSSAHLSQHVPTLHEVEPIEKAVMPPIEPYVSRPPTLPTMTSGDSPGWSQRLLVCAHAGATSANARPAIARRLGRIGRCIGIVRLRRIDTLAIDEALLVV